MNFAAIPAELKERAQWVVWRTVVNEHGRNTKPPFQARNLQYGADHGDPTTWASFDEAVKCFEDNRSVVDGIGYVFSDQDEFFGIDVDAESKVDPEQLETRRKIVGEIVDRSSSYAELSPSGTGLHIIARGKLPIDGRKSTSLQLEVYHHRRYFTITGEVFKGRSTITNEQDLADWLFRDHFERSSTGGGDTALEDSSVNRRLDLSDEEVIREATNFSPSFAPRFNAVTGCGPGEWSETFIAVIGVLDQITGKVDQIRRIVLGSPMVLDAPASGAGESRLTKAQRNFTTTLARVRGNNTGFMGAVAHGRSVMEAIRAKREQVARETAERILAKAEQAFSKNSVELMKAFPVSAKYLELCPPPGIVSEFVTGTMKGCHNPFLKFSLAATIAALAGLVGRSYKLPNGSGLNVNFILAAPTATGKTQVMTAWESFMNRAAAGVGNTLTGPVRNRILKSSAGSIQGIFEDFMQMPSCTWFISECGSQLKQMSDPKSVTDSQLRDAYNDLYDVSKVGHQFSPPRSVANRKANLEPVLNLAVSTFWTTTPAKFDLFSDDAQDGFLSRVIVIRHMGSAGEPIPDWDVARGLPDDLHQRLVTQHALAKNYDEKMLTQPGDAYGFTTIVSTEAVEGQAWAFRQIAERIKNASLSGDMPTGYTAVSRLPMTAMRLAGVLAVMENPYTPAVTAEQFEWAFGYLLQNSASILSDMDTGELGSSLSKDIDVVVREVKKLMRKNRVVGIKKGDLVRHLRFLVPFKNDRTSPGEAVKRTLAEMISHHMIEEVQQPIAGRGRPATLYCPTDDAVWS